MGGWTPQDDHEFPLQVAKHDWVVKRKLGIGSTGAVWHAVRTGCGKGKDGAKGKDQVDQAAIKAYRIQQDDETDGRYLYNEVLRQLKLFHPHIIQFRSLIPTPDYLCLVMEYANAGDLFKFAKHTRGLPEAAARFIFQQLILVLDYCHHEDIQMYIRDVKPSNLLLVWNSNGMPLVKLTDFNLAKDTAVHGPAKTPVGCTMWMAPQAVRNRAKDYKDMIPLGPICDIWSAAVTLYYLLYTKWPFSDKVILEWTVDGTPVDPSQVPFPEQNEHGKVSGEVISLMKSIFNCGNYKDEKEYKKNGGVTLEDIMNDKWFLEDLPEGAKNMKEECLKNTKERLKSEAYQELKENLVRASTAVGVEQTRQAFEKSA